MSIERKLADAKATNDKISDVAREFARSLVFEMESGRSDIDVNELADAGRNGRNARRQTEPNTTERYAQEAEDDYESVREEIDTPEDRNNLHMVRHQSEPTKAAALAKLAREINEDARFNGEDKPFDGDLTAEQILDRMIQRGNERK